MRFFLLSMCLGLFSLYAAELKWADSYADAMIKAKEQKKDIMLLITTNTCRWCRKLESETLRDINIINRLNKNYISVHVTRDEGRYPKSLKATGVPTTYFLNIKGEPIIKKVMGYWNAEDYGSFLDDVDYKLGRKEY